MNMAVMYWIMSFTDSSLVANIRGSECALNGAQLIIRTNFYEQVRYFLDLFDKYFPKHDKQCMKYENAYKFKIGISKLC